MKTILVVLFIVICVCATQWQPASIIPPGSLAINGPSFTGNNLRIYCGIYYSIYHDDIAYYDWSGTQWIYVDRVQGDVNTTQDEEEPFITYDGSKLYFMRSVGVQAPPSYIYIADWNGSGFINSRPLNSLINTGDARYPSLTQDGLKLYYSHGKIWESLWDGNDWGAPSLLPPEVNEGGGLYRWDVTITPDGNEIYFKGAGSYPSRLAFSRKIGGIWQQWQYCDWNINQVGSSVGNEALTYAPYETQELYFARTNSPGTLTWHALRSPVAVEPVSLGQIKANYAR